MKNNVVWHHHKITPEQRAARKHQKPCVLWLTGLSGSGKSTIADALDARLFEMEMHSYVLDGDNIRHGLNRDLGFGNEDRVENIRRIGEISKLFVDAGLIVISAFISPFRSDRETARNLVEDGKFIEIFIDTPLEVCEARDPKGLYQKARRGEIVNFTGIDSPYESSESPDIHIRTLEHDVDSAVELIIDFLASKGYVHV